MMILIRLAIPSEDALLEDLAALLGRIGLGDVLPATRRELTLPWRRSSYRIDWVVFRVIREVRDRDGLVVASYDRGLHADVLVSVLGAAVPSLDGKDDAVATELGRLDEVQQDTPEELLTRWSIARKTARRAAAGSTFLAAIEAPVHAIAGVT